jgi:hypothetical protein
MAVVRIIHGHANELMEETTHLNALNLMAILIHMMMVLEVVFQIYRIVTSSTEYEKRYEHDHRRGMEVDGELVLRYRVIQTIPTMEYRV